MEKNVLNGKHATFAVFGFKSHGLITILELFPSVLFSPELYFVHYLPGFLHTPSTPRIPLHMLRVRRLFLMEYLHFQHA